METKARYVFVGLCSFLAIAVACGLLIFSLKHGDKDQIAYYAIDFSGGVAGLSIGNDVRFNGIKVGDVRRFTINENDPSRVRVVIAIQAETPIRQDSEASLTLQGITGLAVVDITGGSAASPRLPKTSSNDIDDMPFIASRRSTLGSVMEEAPNMIIQANEVLTRAAGVLSPANQASITQILASLAVVTESLERQNKNIETTMENLAQASLTLNKVLEAADKVIGQDLDQGVANFSSSFKRLDDLIQELEPGARRLTGGTADELMRVLNEAQVLLRNVNALVNNLNSDPQRLFFGDSVPGMRINNQGR